MPWNRTRPGSGGRRRALQLPTLPSPPGLGPGPAGSGSGSGSGSVIIGAGIAGRLPRAPAQAPAVMRVDGVGSRGPHRRAAAHADALGGLPMDLGGPWDPWRRPRQSRGAAGLATGRAGWPRRACPAARPYETAARWKTPTALLSAEEGSAGRWANAPVGRRPFPCASIAAGRLRRPAQERRYFDDFILNTTYERRTRRRGASAVGAMVHKSSEAHDGPELVSWTATGADRHLAQGLTSAWATR